MSIFFGILAFIFAIVAAIVVLSYAFVWYEFANREPALMEGRFSPGRLWLAVRLILMESFFLFLTVLQHPLGWFGTAEKNPPTGSGTPVILLHGLFHNRACWLWAKFRLRRRGLTSLHTINLPPWKDIESLTERLSRKVDELRHANGFDKVNLVGHSMGGIIARNYIQLRGGAARVERCVLIASPNEGSKLAPFALSPLGKALLPGSDFLKRLAEAPRPEGVRITAVVNRHDNMVLPYQNTRLAGTVNVELAGLGHISTLYHPRGVNTLIAELTEEHS